MKKMFMALLLPVLLVSAFSMLSCGDDDDDTAAPTATATPTTAANTPTPTATAVPTPTATIPAKMWNKTFGGNQDEYSRQVVQTSDGGYAVVGYTHSWGNGQDDVLVLKLDVDGNVQQQKTFGGTYNDWGNGIVQTADGGYGIACYFAPGAGKPWNGWVFKIDSSLDKVWEVFFGQDDIEQGPNNIYLTEDGGFIMSGVQDKTVYDTHDVLLMKVNDGGSIAWYKQFGEEGQDKSNNMGVCSDGGFIIGAESYSHSNGLNDAWVIRTDANGTVLWEKNFGGGGFEEAVHVEQTSDDGFIVAAYTKANATTYSDAMILKLDENGNEVWRKFYGSEKEDYAWSITESSDGGYVFCGVINADAWDRGGDGWMMKLDTNGNQLWEKVFSGNGHDELFFMIRTNDGGYLAVGETQSAGAGGRDMWLVKTDALGNDS